MTYHVVPEWCPHQKPVSTIQHHKVTYISITPQNHHSGLLLKKAKKNKAGYTAQDAPSMRAFHLRKKNTGQTDLRTDTTSSKKLFSFHIAESLNYPWDGSIYIPVELCPLLVDPKWSSQTYLLRKIANFGGPWVVGYLECCLDADDRIWDKHG